MTTADTDTIVAIATAPGAGGVGVVRLSGPRSRAIAEALCGCALVPRHAHYVKLRAGDEILDDGIALYFAAPASFTGEHVVELQAHGSPVVLRRIVAECNVRGDTEVGEESPTLEHQSAPSSLRRYEDSGRRHRPIADLDGA